MTEDLDPRLDRFLAVGEEHGQVTLPSGPPSEATRARVRRAAHTAGSTLLARVEAERAAPAARMFTLAALMRSQDEGTREQARARLVEIVQDDARGLLTLARHLDELGGWGRATRRALARWYESLPLEALLFAARRTPEHAGWTHRDVLRLAHAKSEDPARNAAFAWLTKGRWPSEGPEPPAALQASLPPPALARSSAPRSCWIGLDISGTLERREVSSAPPLSAATASRRTALELARAVSEVRVSAFTAEGWSEGPDPLGRVSALTDAAADALSSEAALGALTASLRLGATDPALLMRRATAEGATVDLFVVLSSAFGPDERARAHAALEAYRAARGHRARLALVGAIAQPAPVEPIEGLLEVCGYSAELPARLCRWGQASRTA